MLVLVYSRSDSRHRCLTALLAAWRALKSKLELVERVLVASFAEPPAAAPPVCSRMRSAHSGSSSAIDASNARNVAPLTGNARTTTGPIPRQNPRTPCARQSCRVAWRAPR